MKKFLGAAFTWGGLFLVCVADAPVDKGDDSYDMGRYKRKFPNSTTLDYWLDGNK